MRPTLSLTEVGEAYGVRVDTLSVEDRRGNLGLPRDPHRRGSTPRWLDLGQGVRVGVFARLQRIFPGNKEIGRLAEEAARKAEPALLELLNFKRRTIGFIAVSAGENSRRSFYVETLNELHELQTMCAIAGEAMVAVPLAPIANAYLHKLAEINDLPPSEVGYAKSPIPDATDAEQKPAASAPGSAVVTHPTPSDPNAAGMVIQGNGALVIYGGGEASQIKMDAAGWRLLAAEASAMADRLENEEGIDLKPERPAAPWHLEAAAGNA